LTVLYRTYWKRIVGIAGVIVGRRGCRFEGTWRWVDYVGLKGGGVKVAF